MKLFDLLNLYNSDVKPDNCKIHIATSNGSNHPLDVYLAGNFNDWQQWQSKRNFERKYVVSLISLPKPNEWLFAGVFESISSEWRLPDWTGAEYMHRYRLDPVADCAELEGRLVVSFARSGRQAYVYGENWAETMLVSEFRAERMSIAEFPGFRSVNLSKQELHTIVSQNIESWRAALSSVAGIYVISDTATGKLYVGSASGQGGIWQRWCNYAFSGHGGNKELLELVREMGATSSDSFRFAILEIADIHDSDSDILARESHWKKVLLSRQFGFNAN